MSDTEQLELAVDAATDSKSAAKKAATKKAATKKPAAKKTASKTTKAAKSETTETAGEEAKPARKTRKATTKTAEASKSTAASATEGSEEKKPVRRTRKKVAEADAGEPAEVAASAESTREESADEKKTPTRRPRLRAKAKDDAEAASGDAKKGEDASKAESASSADESEDKTADAGKQSANSNNSGSNNGNGGKNNRHNRHQRNQQREIAPSVTKEELEELKITELRAKADELELDHAGMKKPELVEAVYAATMKAEGFVEVEGILDILQDGYGFLRTQGYLPGETDCYVGTSLIRRNNLRKGDMVKGQTRPPRPNEKYSAIQKIISVNDVPLEEMGRRIKFGDLTPVYPDECLTMEHGKNTITARVIDLVSPIGKGQRGLIVSPPKAGKTTILKDIAASISANNPEVHLMCLLVDERPEEVTDMQRSIKGEVISSTFDMPTENHIQVAELVIERAKRLVEGGKDVVILLDSLTRLARAYNLAQPASGRILSGGVDSTALYPPKKFLGAARNIEGGGSLTILASALVETGSKMDEVIFEEFKGTGNMELKLDRSLADRRIFPAIDPVASGTRKEDLLLDPQEAPLIWAVRRILANTNNTERAMDMLIKSLKQTDTNQEFLIRTAKKAQHSSNQNVTEF